VYGRIFKIIRVGKSLTSTLNGTKTVGYVSLHIIANNFSPLNVGIEAVEFLKKERFYVLFTISHCTKKFNEVMVYDLIVIIHSEINMMALF